MSALITRRQFVVGGSAVSAALLAGCGRLPWYSQPPAAKVHRLGFLSGSTPAGSARYLDIFRQALGELGYVEGQNLVIEERWGEGSDARLAEPAAELARLPVDVFVVPAIAPARVAREATTAVPIVVGGGDPVVFGLAASYARPGGSVTGVTNLGVELSGKRLQLLKEAAPSISRVAVFWDVVSNTPSLLEAYRRDAQAVDVDLQLLEVHGPDELDRAFEAAAREGFDALQVTPGPLATAHRTRIVELAARLRWPAMYPQRTFVDEGGLMSYEGSLTEIWRRAAAHVDKILKGANPAEIPVEQPMLFDFVVNLKTARELGITFPPEILLQVTEAIN